MIKIKRLKTILIPAIIIVLLLNTISFVGAAQTSTINLVVDGHDITSFAAPVIENNRTLVPVRFIAESLGATVIWDGIERTVTIEKDSIKLLLQIDSYIVEYNGGKSYNLSDAAPKIINDRTYVPIRLISNAFGIGIEWDGDTRTVIIDSTKTSEILPFFDTEIISHSDGDIISGETTITISSGQNLLEKAHELQIMLLDKATFRGYKIAAGPAAQTSFSYRPSPGDNGEKILVSAYFNDEGTFMGGDSVSLSVNINPSVSISGVTRYQLINESVTISPVLNFQAAYVDYEIENITSGYVKSIKSKDSTASIDWTPTWEHNGISLIKITAYDSYGTTYVSEPVPVVVSVRRELALTGVSSDTHINKPVTLYASRNFDVDNTQFLLMDIATGKTKVIGELPYGGFKWHPKPDDSGDKYLFTRVTDTSGIIRQSKLVRVSVDGSPSIIFSGIGPSQVVTSTTTLSLTGNITPEQVKYILTVKDKGSVRYLYPDSDELYELTYTPLPTDEGDCSIQAEIIYQGKKIQSDKVNFKIYLDNIYGPEAITLKNQFLEYASELALESMIKTGMSAALQTAQAILETGWGQSVPVDKYTGTFSNNLFGIKGTGNNGSVVSNTWEVFNGKYYRVDANFRAYTSVTDGWNDHKQFLMNLNRYKTFRSVMYDSTEGAWALKRAGYATDPLYAIKLIRIINTYKLYKLDETGL